MPSSLPFVCFSLELMQISLFTAEKLDKDGEPDRDKNSLKEKEDGIIKDIKEGRKEEQEYEEIELIIERQEVKRKEADREEEEMDEERLKALASIQLVLEEEKIERREKPDGEADETIKHTETVMEESVSPATKYSRIEEEHRKRMQEIEVLLGEEVERRKKERDEKAKAGKDAKRQKEEDRRKRDEEARKKREEERLKWEEEHKEV